MRELQIITKRPDDMDFMKYQMLRRESNKNVKNHLRGKFIWFSKNDFKMPHPLAKKEYNQGQFRGSTRELIRQTMI